MNIKLLVIGKTNNNNLNDLINQYWIFVFYLLYMKYYIIKYVQCLKYFIYILFNIFKAEIVFLFDNFSF